MDIFQRMINTVRTNTEEVVDEAYFRPFLYEKELDFKFFTSYDGGEEEYILICKYLLDRMDPYHHLEVLRNPTFERMVRHILDEVYDELLLRMALECILIITNSSANRVASIIRAITFTRVLCMNDRKILLNTLTILNDLLYHTPITTEFAEWADRLLSLTGPRDSNDATSYQMDIQQHAMSCLLKIIKSVDLEYVGEQFARDVLQRLNFTLYPFIIPGLVDMLCHLTKSYSYVILERFNLATIWGFLVFCPINHPDLQEYTNSLIFLMKRMFHAALTLQNNTELLAHFKNNIRELILHPIPVNYANIISLYKTMVEAIPTRKEEDEEFLTCLIGYSGDPWVAPEVVDLLNTYMTSMNDYPLTILKIMMSDAFTLLSKNRELYNQPFFSAVKQAYMQTTVITDREFTRQELRLRPTLLAMDVYLDKFMVDEGLENAAAGFHDLLGLLMHIQIPSDNLPTFTALEKSFEQSLCVFLPVDDGPRIRVFITVADPLSRITVLCNKYLYASKHHLLPTDFQQTLLFKDPKNIPDDVEVYYNIQYKWMNEDIPDYITLIDYGMRTPHSEPALYLRLVQDTPPEMGENGVVVKPGLRVIDLSDTVIYGFTGLFKIPNCSHVVSPLTRRIINLFSPLQPKKYRLFHDVIQKLSNEMILRLTQPGESLSCFSPSVEFIYLYPHWFNITVRHIAYRLRNSHYLQRYHLYLRMIRRPPLFPRRHLQKQTLHISKENILEEGISILEDREGFCFKKLKLELVDAWGNTSKCATYEFWDMFVRELGDELFSGRSELLFPKPVVNPKYMRVLGMLVARVILISNPIDLPLNPAFFTLIRGLTYPTLKDVDPSLWKDYASNNPMPTHFFYPLFDEFPLEPDREMRELKTRDDWVEYWRLVESWTCGEIFRNTYSQHFIEGFNSVCSFTGPMRQNHGLGLDELLRIFTDKEIYKLITGYDDFFATARLPEEIIPQKGYDHNSYPYIFLGSLIQTGPVEDHKKILKFITGRSAPPRGGLSFLNPLITIVPSVENTDSTPLEVVKGENVLILPMYSSQGVLARQWKAVRE